MFFMLHHSSWPACVRAWYAQATFHRHHCFSFALRKGNIPIPYSTPVHTMAETLRPAFSGRERPLVSYGIPFADALLKHTEALFGASRIYIICSGSLACNTSYLNDLHGKLGDKLAGARIGLRPHTHWSEILEILKNARDCHADLIVTLGAGSLTDAAKIISFALANHVSTNDELESLCPSSPLSRGNPKPAHVPIVCIPTSLSGGEYSAFAGATNDKDGRKYSFLGPNMFPPSLVILDPNLTKTTPEQIWLSTGVKAVDHCVETLCSLQSDDTADDEARQGLIKLIGGLLRCKNDVNDVEARLKCQLGVIDAMSACSRGIPLGASHGIGHQLGPAGVGHGQTSRVLLPAVCKFNYRKDANRKHQDAVAELLWQDPNAAEVFQGSGLNRDSADLGDLIDAVIRALGLPRTLDEFSIGEERLDSIAEHSLEDRWVKTNPAPLDKAGIVEILRMVLTEKCLV